jgi:hypothetical protein
MIRYGCQAGERGHPHSIHTGRTPANYTQCQEFPLAVCATYDRSLAGRVNPRFVGPLGSLLCVPSTRDIALEFQWGHVSNSIPQASELCVPRYERRVKYLPYCYIDAGWKEGGVGVMGDWEAFTYPCRNHITLAV